MTQLGRDVPWGILNASVILFIAAAAPVPRGAKQLFKLRSENKHQG